MLTKNWYNHLGAQMTGATITNGLKDYNGTNRSAVYADSTPYLNYMNVYYIALSASFKTALSNTTFVVFGDGDTAPTLEDYGPAGEIISDIAVSRAGSYSTDDSGSTGSVLFTITNGGSSAITIREICIYGMLNYGRTNTIACCIDRTVLDTPVTIEAGGVGQVTYTIRMDYPTE